MTVFCKESLDIEGQINLLESRGLILENRAEARDYLEDISYFRLSAYMRPYYVPDDKNHPFIAGTTFRNVLNLYSFDRELRLLLLDAIERLEVSLRAQLTHTLAKPDRCPFYYLDSPVFHSKYKRKHKQLKKNLAKASTNNRAVEEHLRNYRKKHPDSPDCPPVWMALEILSFGQISRLFANLRNPGDKNPIIEHYGLPFPVLQSWFRSLTDLRNHCAHHGRVWNREFSSQPKWPRKPPTQWVSIPEKLPALHHPKSTINPRRRLYYQLVIVATLLRVVSPDSSWAARLGNLLARNPDVPLIPMGFPENWTQEPLWVKAGVSQNRADFLWKAPVGQF